jgi:hypothetical protein
MHEQLFVQSPIMERSCSPIPLDHFMETKERIPALWKPEPILRGLDAASISNA